MTKMKSWKNMLAPSKTTAEWNLFQRGPLLVNVGKAAMARLPFLLPLAVGGAWFVWPALTPEFKGRWGLGPKVEEE